MANTSSGVPPPPVHPHEGSVTESFLPTALPRPSTPAAPAVAQGPVPGAPPTHSVHTPHSSISHLILAHAPLKEDGISLHEEDEDDPTRSPSVGTLSGKKSTATGVPAMGEHERGGMSVFAAAMKNISPTVGKSSHAQPSFLQSLTAQKPRVDSSRFPEVASSRPEPRPVTNRAQTSTASLSGSKTYVAPHLRTVPHVRQSSFGAYEQSGLPDAEDRFYTSILPAVEFERRSVVGRTPIVERRYHAAQPSVLDSTQSRSAPPHLRFAQRPRPPLLAPLSPENIRYHSRTDALDPPGPYSPPSTRISRLPYDDPFAHHHPAPISEEESDGGESLAQYSIAQSLLTQIGLGGNDTPTEANFSPSARRIPASLGTSSATFDTRSMLDSEDSEANHCTSCGAPPAASFVALNNCDHLLCYQCINNLINSAAHKPPRPMNCFACGAGIVTFTTAWVGGEGKMLAALQNSIEEARLLAKEVAATWAATTFAMRDKEERHVVFDMSTTARFPVSVSTSPMIGMDGYESSDNEFSPRAQSTPRTMRSPTVDRLGRDAFVGMDSGIAGTPEGLQLYGLSPMRTFDWASEPEEAHQFDDNGCLPAFDASTMKIPVSPPTIPLSPLILPPTAWPVLRIDNIPWDVTVKEISDWLPDGTLAPQTLSVSILCNRSDGRTLNQCYIEVASVTAARTIVRTRNGKKLRNRPVHITLSTQGEFMSTVFPSWQLGFDGIDVIEGSGAAPLLLMTELSGLTNLCKLETPHASKVHERPYFNIVTILQKFPWHMPSTYNSKQIVRLYQASFAAVEIILALREHIADWSNILATIVEAVLKCPVFRTVQKNKLVNYSGIGTTKDYTNRPMDVFDQFGPLPSTASASDPPSLRESYVTVAPFFHSTDRRSSTSSSNNSSSYKLPPHFLDPVAIATRAREASEHDLDDRMPDEGHSRETSDGALSSATDLELEGTRDEGFEIHHARTLHRATPTSSPTVVRGGGKRRATSIGRELEIEVGTVRAVAELLGVTLLEEQEEGRAEEAIGGENMVEKVEEKRVVEKVEEGKKEKEHEVEEQGASSNSV